MTRDKIVAREPKVTSMVAIFPHRGVCPNLFHNLLTTLREPITKILG
jgi:hypothetical protein